MTKRTTIITLILAAAITVAAAAFGGMRGAKVPPASEFACPAAPARRRSRPSLGRVYGRGATTGAVAREVSAA